jgi:hypothetical protein
MHSSAQAVPVALAAPLREALVAPAMTETSKRAAAAAVAARSDR